MHIHYTFLVFSHHFKGKVGNCARGESFDGEAHARL
jgi:hypothetical protein